MVDLQTPGTEWLLEWTNANALCLVGHRTAKGGWSPVNSILAPGFSQGKNPEYHIHIHGLKLKRMIFTNAMVSMCLVERSIFPKCMKLRKEWWNENVRHSMYDKFKQLSRKYFRNCSWMRVPTIKHFFFFSPLKKSIPSDLTSYACRKMTCPEKTLELNSFRFSKRKYKLRSHAKWSHTQVQYHVVYIYLVDYGTLK